PKPLVGLNHLTVPVAMMRLLNALSRQTSLQGRPSAHLDELIQRRSGHGCGGRAKSGLRDFFSRIWGTVNRKPIRPPGEAGLRN
ncbi:MAG: hypothetical protein U1E18_11670, partial [Brevundimonas sp.]|uniref:hypothetical protein n=1 Tax=Brevundimonas sp. TaxID=1871086 RepID=UPI002AB94012